MFSDSDNTDSHTAVWEFILRKWEAAVPVMLLYVLHSEGSSPGRKGFKMAVAADNSFCGTIGGGIMEHKFVELARAELKQSHVKNRFIRQVHDKTASEQSGMICSGEQTNFLYRINAADIPHVKHLLDSLYQNQNGTLTLEPHGILFANEAPASDYFFSPSEDGFVYMEKTGYKQLLHIIGGGHCSLALCKLMRDMDFFIHVYDNREELMTMEQNHFAHKKTIVADYGQLAGLISGGPGEYAVIMTFGYRTDDEAFRALMGKPFHYLGMLGSKAKIQKMFSEYRNEKVEERLLQKVFAPVGIPINSQTTAEIAVSIAAQIIAEKNRI